MEIFVNNKTIYVDLGTTSPPWKVTINTQNTGEVPIKIRLSGYCHDLIRGGSFCGKVCTTKENLNTPKPGSNRFLNIILDCTCFDPPR